MSVFISILIAVYLIGVCLMMVSLESYQRVTLKRFFSHFGLSLVWPFLLVVGLYQACRKEK